MMLGKLDNVIMFLYSLVDSNDMVVNVTIKKEKQ